MLVTVDKRGSITLPAAVRKTLGLESGSHLELAVEEGGTLVLYPVAVYPSVRLSEEGLKKLRQARKSGVTKLPDWLAKDMSDARTDPEPEVR